MQRSELCTEPGLAVQLVNQQRCLLLVWRPAGAMSRIVHPTALCVQEVRARVSERCLRHLVCLHTATAWASLSAPVTQAPRLPRTCHELSSTTDRRRVRLTAARAATRVACQKLKLAGAAQKWNAVHRSVVAARQRATCSARHVRHLFLLGSGCSSEADLCPGQRGAEEQALPDLVPCEGGAQVSLRT